MRALSIVFAFALLTGCARDDAPADETAAGSTADGVSTAGTVDAAPADGGLPPALTGLNLQTNHASGSVLRVTGVRFAGDHIAVDLAFTNGTDHEQELNSYRGNDLVLRDDLGNVYHVSAPPNNGEVKVPAGQNVTGEFVFLGRLHPDATALTLVTNEQNGGDQDYARDPKMIIQIALTS